MRVLRISKRSFLKTRGDELNSESTAERNLVLASLCFILSGAAALIYQVAWQRLLALTTGVSVHSIAAITAAFMAGLGIGSQWGGMRSERLDARAALRAFAWVEFGVAAFALVSVPFFYTVLYKQMGWLYANPVLAFVAHFASLALPTTLMGMSLPFLTRGLVLTQATASRTIGWLYGANALGAAIGAFATPWILLRYLGVSGAVLAGAALSATAAVGALMLARSRSAAPAAEEQQASEATPSATTHEATAPFSVWVLLYALSGLVSLSLEIVWFRVLDVTAKGAAFTFGTLLSIYLVGLAAGTFVAAQRVRQIARPLRAFLLCQGLMLAATLLAHTLLVRLPPTFPVISWIVKYGQGPSGVTLSPFSLGAFFVMYIALPLFLFGPATFCMGFGFPVLQRAVQRDPSSSGRQVGVLQAANIAGCVAGSLLTGLLLLDAVGTAGTFKLLGCIGAVVAITGAKHLSSRALGVTATALVLLTAFFPNNNTLWLRLHGNPDPEDSFVEEDAASVTTFTPRRPVGYVLWINGRTNSWVPFGSIHTTLGALPALVHPAPKEIAIIGLGSGDTAWAAGVRDETSSVTVFEIATSQPRLLARVKEKDKLGRLKEFLDDKRFSIVKGDGRRALATEGKKYDVIEADAVYPDSGLAGHLYSVEFYELVSRALKPGGIFCAWIPTPRTRASALKAFKHAIDFQDLLILSNEPLDFRRDQVLDRLQSIRTRDYLGASRLGDIAAALARAQPAGLFDPYADFNTDLQPKDEYARPRKLSALEH